MSIVRLYEVECDHPNCDAVLTRDGFYSDGVETLQDLVAKLKQYGWLVVGRGFDAKVYCSDECKSSDQQGNEG